MPLLLALENVELTVIKISSDQKTKQHLASLGVIQGSKITLLSKKLGNIIIKVLDGRIAINEDLARQIIVA